MGTPDFAVPCLEALNTNGYDVTLVITQPDRPKGRDRKIAPPPVNTAALRMGYEVIQPLSIGANDFIAHLAGLKSDIFVVVAFGHILPKTLLELPRLGTIKLHASLLPKYRGPAPIQWAIINGEMETGVTAICMDEGLDTGDILCFEKVEITPEDTSAILHDRLSELAATLLIRTLNDLEAGPLKSVSQDHTRATYAPLLKKSDGRMDWNMPAEKLEAFIRGMTPWPGAFTFDGNKRLKIFKAIPALMKGQEPPGTIIQGFYGELRIATGKGALSVLEIQGESGKRLPIKDFLRGYELPPGTVFS